MFILDSCVCSEGSALGQNTHDDDGDGLDAETIRICCVVQMRCACLKFGCDIDGGGGVSIVTRLLNFKLIIMNVNTNKLKLMIPQHPPESPRGRRPTKK